MLKATSTQAEFDDMPMLITVSDVARILGLHPRTVSNMAQRGALPARKIGDKWRFNKMRIAEYAGLLEAAE